jgi:hypothetical protein
MAFAIIVIGLTALWSLWGVFSSRVEQADYRVTKKASGYEMREYPQRIVAQVTVKGSHEEALNEGFRIVAGYIFGGNTKNKGISMTAPVTEQRNKSEKIAMTAPVLAAQEGGSHVISFGMPRSYTLDTLPTPSDKRVKIVEIPAKKLAVLKFSWFRSGARVSKMEAALLKALTRDKVKTAGNPIFAGYNAPWTPPWMVRNEVMVEIIK